MSAGENCWSARWPPGAPRLALRWTHLQYRHTAGLALSTEIIAAKAHHRHTDRTCPTWAVHHSSMMPRAFPMEAILLYTRELPSRRQPSFCPGHNRANMPFIGPHQTPLSV